MRSSTRWLVLGLALTGCGDACDDADIRFQGFEAFEVWGCAEMRAGLVCEASDDATLTVWVEHPGPIEILGRPPVPWTKVDSGLRAEIETCKPPCTLRFRAGGSTDRRGHDLSVQPHPTVAAVLVRAREARARGDHAAARAALEPLTRTGAPRQRLQAEVEMARLEASAGRGPAAAAHRAAAAGIARDEALVSQEIFQLLSLAHVQLFFSRDLAASRAAIEAANDASARHPATIGLVEYNRGLLAQEVGDARGALLAFDRAARLADRTAQAGTRWYTQQAQAVLLAQTGRLDEAAQAIGAVVETARDPCTLAKARLNRGWIHLLATEAHGSWPTDVSPREDLRTALRLLTEDCPEPAEHPNIWVNLAFDAVQRQDPRAATEALDQARRIAKAIEGEAGAPTLLRTLWRMDLEGRIALLEGDGARAGEIYRRLQAHAAQAVSPDGQWRAAVGLARALVSLGRLNEALEAYRSAEAHLDARVLSVALGQGRGALLAARAQHTRAWIDVLLAADRPTEAAQVARRARTRVLLGLTREGRLASLSPQDRARWDAGLARYQRLRAQLDDALARQWTLPTRERNERAPRLATLRAELTRALDEAMSLLGTAEPLAEFTTAPEVVTLLYTGSLDRLVGFAIRGSRVQAARLEPLSEAATPEMLSQALLTPFAPVLGEARRVRVLASGWLESVDVHALPWRGGPLGASHVVSYAVDRPPRPDHGVGAVLIVSDPQGNLPSARDEARVVQAAFPKARHLTGFGATPAAVRAALTQAHMLHYAGHGRYAGLGGWQSRLPLADGGGLGISDILALDPAPARVILSGCDTGRSEAPVGAGLGLAQAFVLAGGATVIAAVRPVDDELAFAMSKALYEGPISDLAAALHRAQSQLRADHPTSDWAAFRVLEP